MIIAAFVDWSFCSNLEADWAFKLLLQVLDLNLKELRQVVVLLLLQHLQHRHDVPLLVIDLLVQHLQMLKKQPNLLLLKLYHFQQLLTSGLGVSVYSVSWHPTCFLYNSTQ